MTGPVPLTKGDAHPPATRVPASRAAALRRRARSAVARSIAGDRWLAILIGFVLLAAGVLVALLSYGVFGLARAGRPLLDPLIVDALRAEPLPARVGAIAAGVLLVLLGIVVAAKSVRPERRPDLVVDGGGPDTLIVVSAAAAAEAVGAQAASLPGVGRARARLVGTEGAPALRVTLWLTEDADVRELLGRLDDTVLAAVRDSLDLDALPVAVRLELDTPVVQPRVA
jgi:uncharacterized membrane protein